MRLGGEKEKAREGCHRRGPGEVQVRQEMALTFASYVKGEGWKAARLSSCPTCAGAVTSHGTYERKVPEPARVARFWCATCEMTISVLPDFYASRAPGLLAEVEEAVAVAESAPSFEQAAERVRSAEEENAVTLTAAVRWLRRRVRAIHGVLATIVGLEPERFEGCAATVGSFRARLGTTRVLETLRGICAPRLSAIAAPLGLRAPRAALERAGRRHQHTVGPDPP